MHNVLILSIKRERFMQLIEIYDQKTVELCDIED